VTKASEAIDSKKKGLSSEIEGLLIG